MNHEIPCCREALSRLSITDFSNPGLALTRYLKSKGDVGAAPELLKGVQNSGAGKVYPAAFARWKATQEGVASTATFMGTLATPMAIGLGNASPLEIGLTVHHTYGMPVIPGTALKGLCRRGALASLQKPDGARTGSERGHESKVVFRDVEAQCQFQTLFGDSTSAGFCTFWDAWFDPDSVEGKPYQRDVITVHHPKYYSNQGKGGSWPTDFDDPIPIPFLVIRPETRFFFSVSLPNEEWEPFVGGLLRWSLENLGIGAKTNAGYGYFDKDEWIIPLPPPPPVREEIWTSCTLTQKNDKGVLSAVIFHLPGKQIMNVSSKEWEGLRKQFDPILKDRLKNALFK